MDLTPGKIFEEYQKNNLDKHSAADLLISIIDNSDNDEIRVACLDELEKIGVKNIKTFKLLESLLISDSSENVRVTAAKFIRNNFINKALEPMKWALQHEESPVCLRTIYKTLIIIITDLERSNDSIAKLILLDEVKKIKNNEFKIGFEILCETRKFDSFTKKELIDILVNYFTISFLEKTYWRLKFKIENCKVVELDFIFKGLTKLPDAIRYLSSLKKLILRYNQIFNLPDWISCLSSLEILNLNINNINKLPESIGSLTSLKELLLWKNELIKLPDSITSLSSLESLNLRLNQLISIPELIGNLSSLKELNLHDNKLTTIPQSIGHFTLLEKLNLSWNELTDLPDSIGSLSSLKNLDLGRNNLTKIPSSIGSLSSLEILNLSENNLKNIPDTIGSLSSLQILDLSRNELTTLPESIDSISSLKEIYLGDNKLFNLSKSMKLSLKKLENNGVKIYY